MDIEQLAGIKLGNNKIESFLDRGGLALVYKARQLSLGSSVALQIVPPQLGSDFSFAKRFQREVEASAWRHHAGIVQIHDIAEDQGPHLVASGWSFRRGNRS